MAEIVIIGAGPAGISAAEILVANGLRPILIDEGARAGGQGSRRAAADRARGLNNRRGWGAGR